MSEIKKATRDGFGEEIVTLGAREERGDTNVQRRSGNAAAILGL